MLVSSADTAAELSERKHHATKFHTPVFTSAPETSQMSK
jgi:hypothetical protein